MAFPDSAWPCGYDKWIAESTSKQEVTVYWYISSFLRECQEESKGLRSCNFGFAGAAWNLFTSFDRQKVHSLLGINVKPHRFSNAVFDCNCEIEFWHTYCKPKKIDFKFKCENADSHSAVTDFFSDSELDELVRQGGRIICRITLKKSSIKEACPRVEISHSRSNSTDDAHTRTQMLQNYSMAFPDSTWPCDCDEWYVQSTSSEEVRVIWTIESFLRGCQEERKEIRSYEFGFAGATWNLFTAFDRQKVHSLFGVNVEPHRVTDAVFDCHCKIKLSDDNDAKMKKIESRFKYGSSDSYCAVENFLSSSELDEFLQRGNRIDCLITVKKSSNKQTCPEITHSSNSDTDDAHTLNQMLPKGDEEFPMASFESKVCKDFKNLLLSGEDSDVTLQVHDQQFKAHRSILTARSSVFASMFRHDTKEKATGVVNVGDCEPSIFPVLLEFMYCGSTEKLSVDNMFGLYVSADKYDLQDLKMKCLQLVKSNLSVDTFCKTLHLSLQHSETDLLKLATEFFIRNCQQITITPEWQTFLLENPIQGNEMFIKATKYISLNPS